ncbi:hypothetical protein GDO81_002559 [Engystomops pustulosus]|uniref:Solute carrier family 45 member 3 n=1 Tax=Engystomops pustulosus TaxID=76066 RepID=A0AAV7DLA9_ENGPU|nr:hypothetical protein GDO81_002559 [Engystomops pustulosus]
MDSLCTALYAQVYSVLAPALNRLMSQTRDCDTLGVIYLLFSIPCALLGPLPSLFLAPYLHVESTPVSRACTDKW